MCSNQQKLVPILLLQGIKFTTLKTMCCVCARSLSSFGLFASPWTVTQQAPVHGIFQARLLEQVAFPIPGDLPNLRMELVSPTSPTWEDKFLTTKATWEALT